MHAPTHSETPRAVAIRIFGATAVLLGAMLALLHPQAMQTVVHGMMGMT